MGDQDAVDREVLDILLGLAKAVANTTAALVLQSKTVAANCDDQAAQNRVIAAATQCALATSQLVACAKGLLALCKLSCKDDKLLNSLRDAAAAVSKALNDLLAHIKDGSGRNQALDSVHEGAVDNFLAASDRLFAAQGETLSCLFLASKNSNKNLFRRRRDGPSGASIGSSHCTAHSGH